MQSFQAMIFFFTINEFPKQKTSFHLFSVLGTHLWLLSVYICMGKAYVCLPTKTFIWEMSYGVFIKLLKEAVYRGVILLISWTNIF